MDTKVALITGGTSGIGLATTKKFLDEGYKVWAIGADKTKFEEIAEQLHNSDNLTLKQVDVTDKKAVELLVDEMVQKYQKIDVVVNSAGILAAHKDLVDADLANIERTIQINLLGTIYVDKFVGKVMKQQGHGTIINIGSIDGVMANHESVAYHASKGGVHMATKALARELSPFGIRVLCVAPGWVDTGMVPQKARKFGEQLMMSHKLISAAELANTVYLMTLPEAAAINGSIVMADDGYASFKGMGILDIK